MSALPHLASRSPATGDGALLQLRHVGDGRAVYRALARIIVRRELISMGVINDPEHCEEPRLAA